MMKLAIVALLFTLVTDSKCQLFSQSFGATVEHLSPAIITDLYTILISGTVTVTGDCLKNYDVPKIEYWLFTKQNLEKPIIVTSPNQINGSKPIVVLIHGWGGNADIDYINVIKNAYLEVNDWNIISVDYSEYAASNYQTSYCHAGPVGYAVAQFLCNLSETLNVPLSSLHLVGHSLGGQIAGIIGSQTQEQCGSIGRITALDPAGPLFQAISAPQRLDASDALFVDVIHTNQGAFGYAGNAGSVDFYPNCGFFQPGCLAKSIAQITMKNILNLPLSDITCNHQRSCYLFAESILHDDFNATSCLGCGLLTCGKAKFRTSYTKMGESCNSQPHDNEYMITTTDQKPFVQTTSTNLFGIL